MMNKICLGCGMLVPHPKSLCGTCENKKRRAINKVYDKQRKDNNSKYKAFYNSDAWKQLRLKKLQDAEYQCEECRSENKFAIAEEVHHIISVKESFDLRLEYSNLRCLCKEHHNIAHDRFRR